MNALGNIRIIDLSMGWAGPLACRHLADLGADVIKVESCERFDWWRSWEATPAWIEDDGAEKSVAFNMVNRNKRAITLDLEHPEGKRLLLELNSRMDPEVGRRTLSQRFAGHDFSHLDLDTPLSPADFTWRIVTFRFCGPATFVSRLSLTRMCMEPAIMTACFPDNSINSAVVEPPSNTT